MTSTLDKDSADLAKVYSSLTSVSNIGPCAAAADDETDTSRRSTQDDILIQ